MSILVRTAELSDLEPLTVLFDSYRSFYDQASNRDGAREFLRDRFRRGDSTLFLATRGEGEPVGFVQLYPLLSSVAMRRVFLLNDLFVVPEARRMGAGQALMQTAKEHARSEGAVRLTLSTAIDNLNAQRLYETKGYERDTAFHQYNLRL